MNGGRPLTHTMTCQVTIEMPIRTAGGPIVRSESDRGFLCGFLLLSLPGLFCIRCPGDSGLKAVIPFAGITQFRFQGFRLSRLPAPPSPP